MTRFVLATIIIVLACQLVFAQQTNPVDRKVANPMTDTPNVNPLNTDQPVPRRPPAQNGVTGTSTDEITVIAGKQSGEGPENSLCSPGEDQGGSRARRYHKNSEFLEGPADQQDRADRPRPLPRRVAEVEPPLRGNRRAARRKMSGKRIQGTP